MSLRRVSRELTPAEEGLSHHGDPEEEVIVIEDPEGSGAPGPVVVSAPTAPTQSMFFDLVLCSRPCSSMIILLADVNGYKKIIK